MGRGGGGGLEGGNERASAFPVVISRVFFFKRVSNVFRPWYPVTFSGKLSMMLSDEFTLMF